MLLLSFVAALNTTYAAQKAQQDPKITSIVSKRRSSPLGPVGFSVAPDLSWFLDRKVAFQPCCDCPRCSLTSK